MFLTYDMTREQTFINLEEWHKEIVAHASPEVIIYLVGNKADEIESKEVSFESAVKFAEANKIHKVFETSAKTGSTVEEVFMCASKDILKKTLSDIKNDVTAVNFIGGTTPLHRNTQHRKDFNEQGQVQEKGCGC